MKNQLIADILKADTGNMFADYQNADEVQSFLQQQGLPFVKGIAVRCGVLPASAIITELTLLRDHQYQVRDGITVWISQRSHKKGFDPDEAQAVFERKTKNHDHEVILGLTELQQIARFCGYPQPYEVIANTAHQFEPENPKGYAQDSDYKEYKLRDCGWKTNLWVYNNTRLELEHKYGKGEPWNKIELEIADVLAVLALIDLSDEHLSVPPPGENELHNLRWGFQRQLRAPIDPQPSTNGHEWYWNEITPENKVGALGIFPDLGDFLAALVQFCPYGRPGAMRWGRLIESVGVARVQDITEAEALKQGLERVNVPTHGTVDARKWKNYLGQAYYCGANLNTAQESYKTRFISEYGREAWERNDFVWVVNF